MQSSKHLLQGGSVNLAEEQMNLEHQQHKNDIKTMKWSQSEMKNTLTVRKNNLNGINIRVDEAEDQISYL